MSETEGLLATAEVEGDDNQQQTEETISHLPPDTDASPDAEAVATEETDTRPEWLPEKFKSAEDLAGAYAELQKKFSQGKHKVPDDYDQSVFSDAGIPEDDELYSTYLDWAKDNGISQNAFDQLAGKFIELAGGQAEQAEVSYQEEYQKLGPNADATIKGMTQWAQSLVNKGVWGQDDFDEFKIMGGTAQGLKAFQKIRSYYGDKGIPIDVGPVDGAPSKDELQSMIAKPEYQSDPAYRAKVEKLFDKVYGTEDYTTV